MSSALDKFPLAAHSNGNNSTVVTADDSKYADIAGHTFGKLTYREAAAPSLKSRSRQAWFDCSCGGKKLAIVANVKAGMVKSCGCLRGQNNAKPKKQKIMSRAKTQLSEVKTISEAVEAVMVSAEQITPSQQKHLASVYAACEQARLDLHKAVANSQASAGARESFMGFLAVEYSLNEGDTVEVATGKIIRKQ